MKNEKLKKALMRLSLLKWTGTWADLCSTAKNPKILKKKPARKKKSNYTSQNIPRESQKVGTYKQC